MRNRTGWPVLVQLMGVIVLSVGTALGLGFLLLVIFPPPPPAGLTPADVAAAVQSEAATAGSPRLERRVTADPPIAATSRSVASTVIANLIAERLRVPVAAVRVRPLVQESAQPASRVMIIPAEGRSAPFRAPPAETVLRTRISEVPSISAVLPLQIAFPPFETAVLRPDGRWVHVRPARELISPWHARTLLAFAAALALLLPIAFLFARRLTAPLRRLADAADQFALDDQAVEARLEGPAELRRAASALNRMQARIREHVEQRTAMLAAIAHDLKTPLTSLRLRIENAPDPDRGRMATDIGRMQRMIAQILAFVRGTESHEAPQQIELNAALCDYVGDRRACGDPLVFTPGREPLEVTIAHDALIRLLGNLVDNALRFGNGRDVHVGARRSDGFALVTIEDSGPGIPDDQLERVFEPFYRVDSSRNGSSGGTGLGLAIARSIARQSAGDVTLANRAGGGLLATVTLPLQASRRLAQGRR